MRALCCLLVLGLFGGGAFTVRQQSDLVARRLSIPPEEVGSVVREAAEHHKMKVAWVWVARGGVIEVGHKPNDVRSRSGIVVFICRSNGRWFEDTQSQETWEVDTSSAPAFPRVTEG